MLQYYVVETASAPTLSQTRYKDARSKMYKYDKLRKLRNYRLQHLSSVLWSGGVEEKFH